jgi:hypothetical protein
MVELKESESCGWMLNAAAVVYIGVKHRRPERPGSETSEGPAKFGAGFADYPLMSPHCDHRFTVA